MFEGMNGGFGGMNGIDPTVLFNMMNGGGGFGFGGPGGRGKRASPQDYAGGGFPF